MDQLIAIPIRDGDFCDHFGGAETFAFFDIDTTGEVLARPQMTPPEHGKGVFPVWLRQQGVTTVLAGGMGPRAKQIFNVNGIEVITGVVPDTPAALVRSHLAGTLESTGGECHEHGLHDCGHH